MLSDAELVADLEDHRAMVRRLESLDVDNASAKIRREIGRRAYPLRRHYEGVRLLSVVSDRTRYETGFSPHVQFNGSSQLIGDPERLESFGAIDWRETLQSWRILNDPDHKPIRLPGAICVCGTVRMPNELTPGQYAERHNVFGLTEYAEIFRELVSDRRCQHCGKRLPRRVSERRLYCNESCSQENRQKRHRLRENEAVLRRRGGAHPYRLCCPTVFDPR